MISGRKWEICITFLISTRFKFVLLPETNQIRGSSFKQIWNKNLDFRILGRKQMFKSHNLRQIIMKRKWKCFPIFMTISFHFYYFTHYHRTTSDEGEHDGTVTWHGWKIQDSVWHFMFTFTFYINISPFSSFNQYKNT